MEQPNWKEINRRKSEAILLNMAINNVEAKTRENDIAVTKFKQMVEQRYKVYKELHEEENE